MSEDKRFRLWRSSEMYTDDWSVVDDGRGVCLSEDEIVELLNELYEENKELRVKLEFLEKKIVVV